MRSSGPRFAPHPPAAVTSLEDVKLELSAFGDRVEAHTHVALCQYEQDPQQDCIKDVKVSLSHLSCSRSRPVQFTHVTQSVLL